MKESSKAELLNNSAAPTLNPNAATFISYSTPLYGKVPGERQGTCTMLSDNEQYGPNEDQQYDGGGVEGEMVIPQFLPPPPPPPYDPGMMGYEQEPVYEGEQMALPPPQHYPTLSLCASYPPNFSTQSSPEVRGYPIGGLSDLSPPPTATSPWKHELQSTCSEDSALHSDSDNLQEDSLVSRVRKQLEYYFSLENLSTDQYLISQMDGDQYVPIWTVANFNAVKKLTTDIEVIKEALHSSTEVQIDSTGSKVRPVIKRCTLILRDISQHATAQEIAGLFNNSPDCPPSIKCTFAHNNSWFVEFRTEHEALKAYSYFREHPHYFHGDLIKVRIKAKPIQRSSPTDSNPVAYNSALYQGNVPCYPAMLPMMWMPPSGMMPMDHMNYPPQGGYPDNIPDYQDMEDNRFRVRSADSVNHTNRRKPRRNNSSRSGNWRHNDISSRDRYLRSNTYHRHKPNDSDDSSTVSSASSYNVPPSKHNFSKSPVLLNNNNINSPKRGNPPQSNKHTLSGKHLQNKQNTSNKPTNQFSSNKIPAPSNKKVAIRQPQISQEKEIVPAQIQTKVSSQKPPEKQMDLEPSQFPPLSSNSSSEIVKVNTAWCKRSGKTPESPPPKSDCAPATRPPGPLSPRSQGSGRGVGTTVRGSKYGPRSGPFRAESYYSRGSRRTENHISADTSINWRRSQGSKPSRAMRPMRRSNKNTERRETDFVPDVKAISLPASDFSNRPTYSEIAAKSSGNESDPTPLCNGNGASSSEEESNKTYRKTFSEVIAAKENAMTSSTPDHVTISRRSESSDQSAQSPTTPKNEVTRKDDTAWTKSSNRHFRPKNMNLRNVYKLETKLNDLDISEPVFPTKVPVENNIVSSPTSTLDKESDNPNTPLSADIATPRNKPFKAAINWFDDDEEDDFMEEDLMNTADEDFNYKAGQHGDDINHVVVDSQTPEDDLKPREETAPTEKSNSVPNVECQPSINDEVLENGRGGEEADETVSASSNEDLGVLCVSTKPDIFHLEDPPKRFEEEMPVRENASPIPGAEEMHDSEYDSERDEFYSSYCESPGWE